MADHERRRWRRQFEPLDPSDALLLDGDEFNHHGRVLGRRDHRRHGLVVQRGGCVVQWMKVVSGGSKEFHLIAASGRTDDGGRLFSRRLVDDDSIARRTRFAFGSVEHLAGRGEENEAVGSGLEEPSLAVGAAGLVQSDEPARSLKGRLGSGRAVLAGRPEEFERDFEKEVEKVVRVAHVGHAEDDLDVAGRRDEAERKEGRFAEAVLAQDRSVVSPGPLLELQKRDCRAAAGPAAPLERERIDGTLAGASPEAEASHFNPDPRSGVLSFESVRAPGLDEKRRKICSGFIRTSCHRIDSAA